jgi:hypothetical protein
LEGVLNRLAEQPCVTGAYPSGRQGTPATIEKKAKKMLSNKTNPAPRPMSLGGVEALGLYLAKVDSNVSLIIDQIALLQTALAEREGLLGELEMHRTLIDLPQRQIDPPLTN